MKPNLVGVRPGKRSPEHRVLQALVALGLPGALAPQACSWLQAQGCDVAHVHVRLLREALTRYAKENP